MKTSFGVATALSLLGLASAYAQPVISAGGVQDGAAYTADIAQGSVFVVKGTGLSAAGFSSATAPNYPQTLNGVQIRFRPAAGGADILAPMVYTYNQGGVNQLAAILPSATAAGTYNVAVISSGQTSNTIAVNVVGRKPGIVTSAGSGAGPAQATIGGGLILQRFVAAGMIGQFDSRPVHPGERVDLWGTGLGADAASDTGGSSGDQTSAGNIRVLVGGVEVTPAYAGRSAGYPGLDQIAFILPANTTASCFVPVQVRAAGVLSNSTTIAVAAGNACTHPTLTEDVLRRLSQGGNSVAGAFTVASIGSEFSVPGLPISLPTTYAETVGGAFSRYTADLIAQASFTQVPGGCFVYRRTGSVTDLTLGITPAPLDAGAQLTGTLPSGAPVTLPKVNATNVYNATLGTFGGQTRTLQPGTYTLAGTGGADIGAFNAQVIVPAFDWTNRADVSSVNRSQPLTINWTGGSPGWVTVSGYAGKSISGSIQNPESIIIDAALFACIAQGSAGTLTVPASVLQQLPAASFNPLGTGSLEIGSMTVLAVSDGMNGKFIAPLTTGGQIDYGMFGYSVGSAKLLSYQ